MQYQDLICAFAEKIGIGSPSFAADGSVAFLFDGEHEVTITPDADDRAILFHAEVGSSANLDKNACRRLLKASLLGAETCGAAFALHEALDTVLLWKRHDDAFAGCADFERAVNAFLAQVIVWKEQFQQQLADLGAAEPATASRPASPSDAARQKGPVKVNTQETVKSADEKASYDADTLQCYGLGMRS
ncbi:MAG: type III secretion system chaperone [Desulfovibrio sp.]|nr:type III secretion system chaperone [Desulfovibrio sp.]